jgi:hypothetical protein
VFKIAMQILVPFLFVSCAHHGKGRSGQMGSVQFNEYHKLYFSKTPDKNSIADLKAEGIVVVYDLSSDAESKSLSSAPSKADFESNGIAYKKFIWNDEPELSPKLISSLEVDIMKYHHEGKKVLVYCPTGNKGPAWFGTHVAKAHKDRIEKAVRMAKHQGLKDDALEQKLRKFVSQQKGADETVRQ